jgi:hypothetical protein
MENVRSHPAERWCVADSAARAGERGGACPGSPLPGRPWDRAQRAPCGGPLPRDAREVLVHRALPHLECSAGKEGDGPESSHTQEGPKSLPAPS